MNRFDRFSKSTVLVFLTVLLLSCDKEWKPFAYYYPRKHYPGRGEATIQGEKLSGRFGYRRDNNKGKYGLLYISGVIPMAGRTSEWTVFFGSVPAKEGTYGLIPAVGAREYTCNREPFKEQVSVSFASATGDASGYSYNPYCKDTTLLSQIKITRISNGNVDGEFSMMGVNMFDSTDFVTIEKGRFSSPEIRE